MYVILVLCEYYTHLPYKGDFQGLQGILKNSSQTSSS